MKLKLLIYCILLFHAVHAFSQQNLTDSLVDKKISYIENSLQKSVPAVNRWWYGWLGTYTVATGVQAAIGFSSNDKSTRQDMFLGSATTVIGAVFQGITPLHTDKDFRLITQLPDSTPELKAAKLAKAEELFRNTANIEKVGRSWQIHALNEAVNLGSGLITWLAFKRSVWDGVSNFLLNSAVTEIQIWTQPNRTQKDYEKYINMYIEKPISEKPQTEYHLKTYPGGVALSIVF